VRIVVLAGGIGGARFLRGVRAWDPAATVTAIVNVGDDVTMHGLRICPDLDSVMYTLAGAHDEERGWGRTGETWVVKEELAAYGAEPSWFGLGDKDIATHLVRSRMLDAGYPLSAVTAAICTRWFADQTNPVRLLPATDQRLETHVVIEDDGGRRAIHFQEWWVRYRAGRAAQRFVFVGADQCKPAAGVTDALAEADLILLAPSNPVVSIGPILAVPGLREAVLASPAPIIGVSPVIDGAPVRGMADKCLAAINVAATASAVGGLFGARRAEGLLDGWLVDLSDADAQVTGTAVRAVPLWMTDVEATAAIVAAAAELAGVLP
jgi:LPPG:FO 2-phospho-L-lactate transferase